MRIDIVSDVMCPWCYIGKRRLETAMAGRLDLSFDVTWRPFKLDGTIPEGGMDRKAYLERKFGGPEAAADIYARISEAGHLEGIAFAFDAIPRSPNTTNAHRLIRWAGDADVVDAEHTGKPVQDAIVERLFARYFLEGGDVESPDALGHLADAATDADLGDIETRLRSDEDRDIVAAEIEHAQRIGVTGVPTFIFDNRLVVVGAQGADVLMAAMAQAEQAADETATA